MTARHRQILLLPAITALAAASSWYLQFLADLRLWGLLVPSLMRTACFLAVTAVAPLVAIRLARLFHAGPLVQILLSGACGGIASAAVQPHLGVAWGLTIGSALSYPKSVAAFAIRAAMKLAIAAAIGWVRAGLVRHADIDGWHSGWTSLAIGLTLLLQFAVLLSAILFVRERNRARQHQPAWYWSGGIALGGLLTLVVSWGFGWHGELARRVRRIEARKGQVVIRQSALGTALSAIRAGAPIAETLGKLPFDSMAWHGTSTSKVMLYNPLPEDFRTLRALPDVTVLTLTGKGIDDALLAELPPLPRLAKLQLIATSVTGRIDSNTDHFAKLEQFAAMESPFDDEGLLALRRSALLKEVRLFGTEVTPSGLLDLANLPEWPVVMTDVGIEQAVEVWIEPLQNGPPELQYWLVRNLNRLDPAAFDSLIPNLHDLLMDPATGFEVRRLMLDSLRAFDPTSAMEQLVPAILHQFVDGTPDLRGAAFGALAHLGDAAEAAIPALQKQLETGEVDSQFAAAEVLVKIGTDEALAAAEQFLVRASDGTMPGQVPVVQSDATYADWRETAAQRLVELRIRREIGPELYRRHEYRRTGQWEQAAIVFEKLLGVRTRILGKDHPDTWQCHYFLGEVNHELGETAAADSHLVEYVGRTRGKASYYGFPAALTRLGKIRFEQARFAEAEALFRERIEITPARLQTSWSSINIRRWLGTAIARQGDVAAAEPILLDSYDRLVRRSRQVSEALRHRHLANAANALVELYAQSGQSERVAHWRRERQRWGRNQD